MNTLSLFGPFTAARCFRIVLRNGVLFVRCPFPMGLMQLGLASPPFPGVDLGYILHFTSNSK